MSLNTITIFEMGKVFTKIAYISVYILMLSSRGKVDSRHLYHQDLLSDGVSDGAAEEQDPSFLNLKGMDSAEEHCKLMYGFLPCSTSVPSHIFLIMIYEYLLYHGESYAGGDGRIFRILGNNFYVAILSQLLDSLPESLILLATGLTTSKEKAQEYVATGAGLLAGSSILLLTLLWGVCIICAGKEFYVKHDTKPEDQGTQLLTGSGVDIDVETDTKVMFILRKVKNKVIKLLTGYGVVTDEETKFHAKVIFSSLIPFVVILLPSVFGISYTSEDYKIVLVVSLSVSVICLFSYFYHQKSDKRIHDRRLEYAEVERKIEMHVPFYEVQALMLDREKHLMTKQKEMEKKLKHPEPNESETMTREKFYDLFQKWLDETRQLMDDPYSIDQSGTEYNQVAELLREDKAKMMRLIYVMIGDYMLIHDGHSLESFTDIMFKRIDANNDKSITQLEIKNFIMEMNYDEILMDDEITEMMMRGLDIDRSGEIDEQEFKSGVKKWIKEISVALHKKENMAQDNNRETDQYHQGEAEVKSKERYWAIALLIVGLIMLTGLAEPLVESVQKFSESVKIAPFYTSFILVPLATNARTAIAAVRAAQQKRHKITSITLSEIYHKVFMNNILGFIVLVSVIYCRGLTWHFFAETLVVFIVCVIMGLLSILKTKFQNWTLFIAFSLYPLSLVMVYLFDDTFDFA